MGYDAGHSRELYLYISSGESPPPMSEFFSICKHFNITPAALLNDGKLNPKLIQKASKRMRELNDSDLPLILNLKQVVKIMPQCRPARSDPRHCSRKITFNKN